MNLCRDAELSVSILHGSAVSVHLDEASTDKPIGKIKVEGASDASVNRSSKSRAEASDTIHSRSMYVM